MMTDYKELYLLYCANLCADSNDYTTKETIFYKGIMPSETGFRFSSGL